MRANICYGDLTVCPLKSFTVKFVGLIWDYGKSDLNNWSALLHVTHNQNKFLFTGDAEKASETDYCKSAADVLKVGCHGAKTSFNTDFLKAVKSKYAVISVGKDSYDYPNKGYITPL